MIWRTVGPNWCLNPREMMDVHAVELMGEDRKADQEAFGDPVAGGWCPNQRTEAAGAIGWGGHLP